MMLSIGDARLVDSFYFFSLIASYVFIVAEKPLYMTKEKYIVMFILAATNWLLWLSEYADELRKSVRTCEKILATPLSTKRK